MPVERRRELYEIAVKRNLILIEDDPYGRLRYRGSHIPPIKSFDRTGHVLYLSTFSKTVSPGFRTGWIVAPKEIREKLIITKQAADLHTSSLDQLILERYLRDFDNRAHVEKVRASYGERFTAMNAALRKHMGAEWSWTHPEGGMFLWVKGPEGIDTKSLFLRAIENNVAFVPGEDFFPDGGGRNFMRLNFSNSNETMISEGVSRLARICASAEREEL
jgi:2-aminoadipate transaminase